MESKLYKVTEVAKYLKLSDNAIRKLLKRGVLEGFKVGKAWRVTEEELKRLTTRREKGKA